MLEDLAGKVVLVTGASSGIGAAIAQAFGRLGASVGVHYNTHREAAERVAGNIEAGGGRSVVVQADLSDRENCRRIVGEVAAEFGRLNILVNNAGAIIRRQPFRDLEPALYEAAFNLNVESVISLSQAAIPLLESQGGGTIINFGSVAGSDGGGPGSGHYASAKAYVHNLTRHMARDLAPSKIRVNCIAPGVIDTPFHSQTPSARMETMRASVVMGRLGTPEDCVGPTLFLASDAMSGYVTGQIIHVNGGQFMP